jgi:hypothetical protein
MEAWWNDPESEQGIAKARRNTNDEYLTRLAFSWKRLKLTGHSSPLSTMVVLGNETKRFQPAGHRAGSLAASR